MDKKQKTKLLIIGIAELVILIFCLTVSILVIVTLSSDNNMTPAQIIAKNGPLIGWFQTNPVWFFCLIVLPLFVLFVADGVYLIVFLSKRQSALSDKERDTIQEEARRQAREELLKEMHNDSEAKPVGEAKAADPKPVDPAPKADVAAPKEKK